MIGAFALSIAIPCTLIGAFVVVGAITIGYAIGEISHISHVLGFLFSMDGEAALMLAVIPFIFCHPQRQADHGRHRVLHGYGAKNPRVLSRVLATEAQFKLDRSRSVSYSFDAHMNADDAIQTRDPCDRSPGRQQQMDLAPRSQATWQCLLNAKLLDVSEFIFSKKGLSLTRQTGKHCQ